MGIARPPSGAYRLSGWYAPQPIGGLGRPVRRRRLLWVLVGGLLVGWTAASLCAPTDARPALVTPMATHSTLATGTEIATRR